MMFRAALWSMSLVFTAGVLEAMAVNCLDAICSEEELRSQTPLTGLIFNTLGD